MKKILWIDVETTGLDFKLNEIVQLSFMIEIDGEIKEKHNYFIQPTDWEHISPQALEVNGLTIEKMKTFAYPEVVYKKIVTIFDKYIDKYNKNDKFSPAGYNVYFDREMLNRFFLRNNNKYFGSYCDYHLIDPSAILALIDYKKSLNLENYKLVTACKHFGVEIEHAHDAMCDIISTRKLVYKILEYIK